MKKKWSKPNLDVIVRNKPEEAILAACRNGIKPGGANETDFDCKILTMGCGKCFATEGS